MSNTGEEKPVNQASLDKHFRYCRFCECEKLVCSKDVEQLARLERLSTLKAIAKDQRAVEKLLDEERRSPRQSPAPPQLQRMEHSMSEEELKKLDAKAREELQKAKGQAP
eukprot:Gregarina_sp_Poly_1__2006@NODE_1527_length_3924_cov_82_479907_g1010_i0_p5_GENE_NODE_1527_length_3924_cov_82_479907_g1010_i0NODE_1527_length_3924_cov_82_479907_g1010_i0_p5_ORF_typecomplete_len110_score21_16DUF2833/PF11090_8/0_16DUF4588/PF15251_6/0_23_NODE_1527_length_3924_cov_82_479907_g1010_i011441473